MIGLTSIAELAGALVTITGACGLVTRFVTRDVMQHVKDVTRDVRDVSKNVDSLKKDLHDSVSDLKHSIKNEKSRIDAVEHLRTADVERIVKVEAAVQSFDKAVERVERGQEKLTDTINDRFDTLATSIREMRVVTPRG